MRFLFYSLLAISVFGMAVVAMAQAPAQACFDQLNGFQVTSWSCLMNGDEAVARLTNRVPNFQKIVCPKTVVSYVFMYRQNKFC